MLELCMLGAVAYSAAQVHIVLGVLAPVAVAFVWGNFVSPKAARRLQEPDRIALEIVLFGLAALGLVAADKVLLGVLFAIVVALNLTAVYALNSEESPEPHG